MALRYRKLPPVPVSPDELLALYSQLNAEFFDGALPLCEIKWSRALTRAAGNIRVESKVITLSVPLLLDVWKEGTAFEVCGIWCASPREALAQILKHEMIHLWLHQQQLPCGHTREFRLKAWQIGQPKTRHGIARPAPKVGWIYECASCNPRFIGAESSGAKWRAHGVASGKAAGNMTSDFGFAGAACEMKEEAQRATR